MGKNIVEQSIKTRRHKFPPIKDIKTFYISAKNIDDTFRSRLYQDTFISVSIIEKLIPHTMLYLAHMSTYFYNISTRIDRKLDTKFFDIYGSYRMFFNIEETFCNIELFFLLELICLLESSVVQMIFS